METDVSLTSRFWTRAKTWSRDKMTKIALDRRCTEEMDTTGTGHLRPLDTYGHWTDWTGRSAVEKTKLPAMIAESRPECMNVAGCPVTVVCPMLYSD